MSGTSFAKIQNGTVTNIIVASSDFIEQIEGGGYLQAFPDADGDAERRFNYPAIGDAYDQASDAFYSPVQPYPSWSLTVSFKWDAPTPYPSDGKIYMWDEATLSWVAIT